MIGYRPNLVLTLLNGISNRWLFCRQSGDNMVQLMQT